MRKFLTEEHKKNIKVTHLNKKISESATKLCPRCKIILPRDNFRKRSIRNAKGIRITHSYCLPCEREYSAERQRKYILEHPEIKERVALVNRKACFKRSYGISLDIYDEMLKKQKGVCAICKKKQIDRVKKYLCVDHCHTTNKIRGLLCSSCNRMLGDAKDNIKVLKNAINYLS